MPESRPEELQAAQTPVPSAVYEQERGRFRVVEPVLGEEEFGKRTLWRSKLHQFLALQVRNGYTVEACAAYIGMKPRALKRLMRWEMQPSVSEALLIREFSRAVTRGAFTVEIEDMVPPFTVAFARRIDGLEAATVNDRVRRIQEIRASPLRVVRELRSLVRAQEQAAKEKSGRRSAGKRARKPRAR